MAMAVLAMHMANELLSIPVAAATILVAAAAVAIASSFASRNGWQIRNAPLMGVMGAFVFAAQMINITLPGMPGTSGHLGGGVLLAILLGPASAIVTMAAILIIQCLLFQDGGLLALGCNIINMGVVPCLLGGWLYRLLSGRSSEPSAIRQYMAAWLACVPAVAAGAALVPLQAHLSGVLKVPLGGFLTVMAAVHLLIGLVEGAITFAVIAYLRGVRPGVFGLGLPARRIKLSGKAVTVSLLGTAVLLAGVVSWFASTQPDGLEWSYLGRGQDDQAGAIIENTSPAVAAVEDWQGRWTAMSDYTFAAAAQHPPGQSAEAEEEASWPNVDGWASLAGLIGTVVCLAMTYAAARLIHRKRPVSQPI